MSERESEHQMRREETRDSRIGRVLGAGGRSMLTGAALICGLGACGSSSDDGGATDAAAGGSTGGTPMLDDMGTDASGGASGGAGGGLGGAGGEGGAGGGSTEQPPDVRCPDLQAGEYLLIAYPDRVDAYRQRDFGASFFCTFLDLRAAGITNAGGFARSPREDGLFYLTATNNGRGEIHAYDADGNYVERVTVNINLADIDGLWSHPSGDAFVAWSKGNSNFYELDGEGGFRGPWLPPLSMTSRVEGVTDLLFLDAESAIATFSNRPPKLYKHPFAPDFPADQIGAANAIAGIATEEGTKLLISGEAGGAGNGFGVMLYKAAASGRVPPELEAVLVQPGEFTDGVGLLSIGAGFLLLDSAIAGSAKLVTFNAEGALQEEIGLEGGGNPFAMFYAQIFPSY